MRIHILSDNVAGRDTSAEWGLSLYIEADKNVLFDFGASDLYLENAKKMGLDFSKLDYTVLSHGHWDHSDGLKFFPKKKAFLAHPDVFLERFSGKNYVGLSFSKEELDKKMDSFYTREVFKISEQVYYLGEIPRVLDFEGQQGNFLLANGEKDLLKDDSGLAIKTKKGIVVVSGCAHSGICNTIEYVKSLFKEEKIYAIIGGFHLQRKDELTKKTIAYLEKEKVEKVYPMHCTGFKAMVEFDNVFSIKQLKTGQIVNF